MMHSKATKAFRIPPMPSLSDLVKLFQLTAQKKLGQNFLLDKNMNTKIARLAGIREGCTNKL